MGMGRTSLAIILAGTVAACGGGDSGGGSGSGGLPTSGTGGTAGGGTTTAGCTVADQQDFAKLAIDDWFLYPELIDSTVSKANYPTVQGYIDAVLHKFFEQKKNAQFTYVTSIAEENAYYSTGSSAGFGIRLGYDTASNRVFVTEAFENAPALNAGIDRGTEIVGIGTSTGTIQSVQSLMQSGGPQAVSNALGPSAAGTTRVLQINKGGTLSTVTVTKADFALDPVSNRYGAKILDNGGTRVGYINLRTFIDTADADLRSAVATFKAQGVTQVIVDVRYNGGGLVRTAELFGDLLAADKVGKVFSYTTFNAKHANENETKLFASQPEAIPAIKLAFITTPATASASELLANAFVPYLPSNMALVGGNTYGKPVGQVAIDKAACDQRMRVVAFKTENANRQGDYFKGLAMIVPQTCAAGDDITHQLGDPQESSVKAALDYLGGRTCTPITSSDGQRALAVSATRKPIVPEAPTAAQYETPGLF